MNSDIQQEVPPTKAAAEHLEIYKLGALIYNHKPSALAFAVRDNSQVTPVGMLPDVVQESVTTPK